MTWEGGEGTADHVLGTPSQLGLDDTLGDGSLGLLGALAFVLVLGGRTARRA